MKYVKNFLRFLCAIIVKPICFVLAKIIYRVKIVGIENIPKDSGSIICGNHVHALDAPVLVASTLKPIRFMAKKELWKNVGFRFMAWIFNVFPVNRSAKDTEAVKTSLKILKDKKILGIYPEGTRNGIERGIKPKNGAVSMAIKTGNLIVPFGVQGSFKPFTKVTYNFGEPMDFSGYKENIKDKQVMDTLTNELMIKIVELRDENVR